MQLPFGEWLPDQPDHLNPGATVATNVYHAQTSYKPVKGLVAYSGASNVTQNAKGAGSFRDNTNTVFTFVATIDEQNSESAPKPDNRPRTHTFCDPVLPWRVRL